MSRATLGATVATVRAQCVQHQGTFEASEGEGVCRGAKAEWSPTLEVHAWFQAGKLAAQTSYGPPETFHEAQERADRLAALSWGRPEEVSRTYVCGGTDLAARVVHAGERRCRLSRYFGDDDRVVHILVAFRGGHWQAVLDEQRTPAPAQAPAGMKLPYPTEMGPFKVGATVSQTSAACTAAGGRYTPGSSGNAASCRPLDIKSLKLSGATAWLADCKKGLCRATFVVEVDSPRDAIDVLIPTRDVLLRAFGPPADLGPAVCGASSASRLAAALELGHCEPVMVWKKDDGIISITARPADNQPSYPPARYSVDVTFRTPMLAEEERSWPPVELPLPAR